MQTLLAVAAGGALGAVSRYLTVSLILLATGGGFPWGTLTVNVLGSFLMGMIVELFALHVNVSQDVRFFLMVGFLGSFTTYSTFSLDVHLLLSRGEWLPALSYIAASNILSVAALMAGLFLIRPLAS